MDKMQEKLLPIIIRTTVILLFVKIIIIELCFIILYTAIILLLLLVRNGIGIDGLGTDILLYITLSFVKMIAICAAALHWVHDYYELRPGIVMRKQGIFKKRSVSFRLQNIIIQSIDQSFFGRMFHYGTIDLQNQFLSEHFSLSDIPHPQKYITLIKDCMEEGITFSESRERRS